MKEAGELPDAEGWAINNAAVPEVVRIGRRHGGPDRLRREAQAQLDGQVATGSTGDHRSTDDAPCTTRPVAHVAATPALSDGLGGFRLILHVLAATVWVGGQFTVAGLLPTIRTLGEDAPKKVAQAFGRLLWPAYAVLVITGFWNISSLTVKDASIGLEDRPDHQDRGRGAGRGGRVPPPAGHHRSGPRPSGARSGPWPRWPPSASGCSWPVDGPGCSAQPGAGHPDAEQCGRRMPAGTLNCVAEPYTSNLVGASNKGDIAMHFSPPADLFGETASSSWLWWCWSCSAPPRSPSWPGHSAPPRRSSRRAWTRGVGRRGTTAAPGRTTGRDRPRSPRPRPRPTGSRSSRRRRVHGPLPDRSDADPMSDGVGRDRPPAAAGARDAGGCPFWVLQATEIVVALVFADLSVHVAHGGLLMAVGRRPGGPGHHRPRSPRALPGLRPTAPRPAGRRCWPSLSALAPFVPALRPDIEGIIVIEFGAVGLFRVATLTRTDGDRSVPRRIGGAGSARSSTPRRTVAGSVAPAGPATGRSSADARPMRHRSARHDRRR